MSRVIVVESQQSTGDGPKGYLHDSDLYRKHGISNAHIYHWRYKFGGIDASLMKRLKELKDEYMLLKKIYAKRS